MFNFFFAVEISYITQFSGDVKVCNTWGKCDLFLGCKLYLSSLEQRDEQLKDFDYIIHITIASFYWDTGKLVRTNSSIWTFWLSWSWMEWEDRFTHSMLSSEFECFSGKPCCSSSLASKYPWGAPFFTVVLSFFFSTYFSRLVSVRNFLLKWKANLRQNR